MHRARGCAMRLGAVAMSTPGASSYLRENYHALGVHYDGVKTKIHESTTETGKKMESKLYVQSSSLSEILAGGPFKPTQTRFDAAKPTQLDSEIKVFLKGIKKPTGGREFIDEEVEKYVGLLKKERITTMEQLKKLNKDCGIPGGAATIISNEVEIKAFFEGIEKDDGEREFTDEEVEKYIGLLKKQRITTMDKLKSKTYEMLRDCGLPVDVAQIISAEVERASAPLFDATKFVFKDYVDSTINNKDQKSFEERKKVVHEIADLAHEATTLGTNNKPWAISLFSPRGTGKTSVIRHLALNNIKTSNGQHEVALKDLGDCGRLLVVDWGSVNLKLRNFGDILVRSLILWHCSKIFQGTSVQLKDQQVVFPAMVPPPNLLANCLSYAKAPGFNSSYDQLVMKRLNTLDDAMALWKELTASAFNLKNSQVQSQPAFLFDTSEALCELVRAGSHKGGQRRTQFSEVAGALPQNTIVVWVGTKNLHTEQIPLDATKFFTKPVAGLPGLSFEATKRMRNDWKSKLSDDDLKLVWHWTCGVPRLLEYALQHKAAPYSGHEALAQVKVKVETDYTTGTSGVDELTDDELARVVLAIAVRWELRHGQKNSSGHVLVPGTQLPWSELLTKATVFKTDDGAATIPRYWIEHRIPRLESSAAWPRGVKFDDLVPDVDQFLSMRHRGPTARGAVFERLFTSALAARYVVHVAALNPGTPRIPLKQLYPTSDAHVTKLLEPFEVCLSDGVHYSKKEVLVSDKPKTKDYDLSRFAVANTKASGAHHDLLLPVYRCKSKKATPFFIPLQLRYGALKGAHDLKKEKQIYRAKSSRNIVPLLLQVCSKFEGKQGFGTEEITLNSFQDQGKYAVINGQSICKWRELVQII